MPCRFRLHAPRHGDHDEPVRREAFVHWAFVLRRCPRPHARRRTLRFGNAARRRREPPRDILARWCTADSPLVTRSSRFLALAACRARRSRRHRRGRRPPSRFIIEGTVSLDTTLAILGIAAVVVGTLRIVGAFRDEPGDRPRPTLRLALGASEIGIGVVWIVVDDVSRTVTVVGGLCTLVVGTSMLVGALDMGRRLVRCQEADVSSKSAMNLMAVMLGRNRYAAALVVTKLERPVTSIGGPPVCLRNDEDALRRVLGAGQRILRPRVEPDGPREFAVVDPPSLHELVLVLDVRVDEVKEDPALDPVVRLRSGHRSARTADRDESAGGNCCCRPGIPWPATGEPRGLTRRMCAPTGQRIPFGSPEPSAFTYSKSFNCSSEIPPPGCPCPVTRRAERRCAIARTSSRPAVQDRSCPCSTAGSLRSRRRRSRPS